ncbi:MAG: DmsC/YnfH family molybdoenzyme membrane anchor subunit [Verrucomicrobiota bacterium]
MSLVSARNLIDELIADQQRLTAVERFSQQHGNLQEPLQAPYYKSLIPLSAPGEGEQYSFEVDLDACSGCKACVTACHSLNGLDEGESWRDVGALVTPGVGEEPAAQQTVTSACHHCVDPACANGCPTLAYEKEADTGVVRHLDDQCIGCQYCTMMCPYDVPKYNDRLGIVRKCDMCQDRLREGEAPACVQACPNEAIRIRIVPQKIDRKAMAKNEKLLPGTAPSRLSLPTTRFLNLHSKEVVPADNAADRPAHDHLPLAIMLTLTQAGAGIFLFDVIARFLSLGLTSPPIWHVIAGFVIAQIGLVAATFHLGRPLQAWRSFLGWRKSWLSREILVFGGMAGAQAGYIGLLITGWFPFLLPHAGGGAVTAGLLGVFCSIMVYAVTGRPLWSFPQTAFRFGLTTLSIGAALVVPWLGAFANLAKLLGELFAYTPRITPFPKSSRIAMGPLRVSLAVRVVLSLVGSGCLLFAAPFSWLAWLGALICLIGECLARRIYFQAVDHTKMPGGVVLS